MDIRSEEYRQSRKVSRLGQAFRVGAFALLGTLFMIQGAEKTAEDPAPERDTHTTQLDSLIADTIPEGISSAFDTTGIFELRAEFSRTQLGRDLLKIADDHKITMGYDLGFCTSLGAVGTYGGDTLRLHPMLDAGTTIVTMAHELWHMRQEKVFGLDTLKKETLQPKQLWNLSQYIEADAFAFSSYFLADRVQQDGMTLLSPCFGPPGIQQEMAIARELLDEMNGDGLSLAEYRNLALKPAFSNLGDYYLQRHFRSVIARGVESANGLPELAEAVESRDYTTMKMILGCMQEEPAFIDSAAFEKILRSFGGFSLDAKDSTSLQESDVSSKDLLKHYPDTPTGDALGYRAILQSVIGIDINSRDMMEQRDSLAGEAEKLLKHPARHLPWMQKQHRLPPGSGI